MAYPEYQWNPSQATRMLFDIKCNMTMQLSDEDEKKPLRLKHIGDLFYGLYCQSYNNADLDRAIAAYEAAVRLTPDGHRCQAGLHSQLGISLRQRFEYYGNVADIDNAIFVLERGLILTPDGHADKPACLNNLGNSFLHCFKCSGDLADSGRAISAHKRAVNLTPNGHADIAG